MKLSECKVDANLLRDVEFSKLGSADSGGSELLVYADSLKHLNVALENPGVCAIVTTSLLAEQVPGTIGLMVADTPRDVFYTIHETFVSNSIYHLPFKSGIGKHCKIHPSALIADGCCIGDHVVIGEHVIIRAPVWIGSHVTIESGVKIGVDGILYRRTATGPRLIPHGGYVRINDNAILMTNSVVVRSVHDTDVTEVGNSALIGLATIVGHEAKVGARTVVSNQCVIARKSVIGEDAFIGTQCMIKENIKVGAGASVMAGSVVISDVAAGESVSGNFATEHRVRSLEYIRTRRRSSITVANEVGI
jgi:acyl-[acyl carrier protein]--UDP-N-acetylglucosamine O-acyltransferase